MMFAQDLSGIFDKSRRHYVAVWISSLRRLKGQLLKRSGGQSIRRHAQADVENVCNGAFWTVTVGRQVDWLPSLRSEFTFSRSLENVR